MTINPEAPDNQLSNADIAELLAVAAEDAGYPLKKALRRAARKALLWPEEAAILQSQGLPLTELSGIGPHLQRIIKQWFNVLPDIPAAPEIRSSFFTWTQAQSLLQNAPSWIRKIRGDLQMHTVWSDGLGSIEEMAEAAEALGYEYISVTDHSKGLKIAGGIDEEELVQQGREIVSINQKFAESGKRLRVLRSIELNLSPAGEGDMEPASLARLDLVLGCFHSALRRKEDQTERYIAGLRNPAIQIMGHPRGRIYNFRLGLTADWFRVFAVAAELDKAVEIDCYPDRQDLSVDLLRLAKKAGCRISLGTDSHGPTQLRFIEFGLAALLASGIDRERVVNFMSREQLVAWIEGVRRNQCAAA